MKSSVLFGNGLNMLSFPLYLWKDLLEKLKGTMKFDSVKTPNTMIYERIILNRLRDKKCKVSDINVIETEVKNEIAEALKYQSSNELYKDIISLGLDNYMTTNYDYALRDSFDDSYEFSNCSTESIYSLRRHTSCEKEGYSKCKIWNIHGEIESPISIKLGLDHYCGSIGKIDSYIKGNYTFISGEQKIKASSMKEKLISNKFDSYSWVELFFSSNVHIIGLSLDFSETDLWWVLDKRARMYTTGMVENKIFFYVTDGFDFEKKELLEAMNVVVIEIPIIGNEYFNFYKSAISCINLNIEKYDR